MKYKILLDMDGVIADFVDGISRYHNKANPYLTDPNERRWDIEQIWGMSKYDLWHGVDKEFWAGLRKTDEADYLVKFITNAFSVPQVTMLTSPPKVNAGEAVQGKIVWMRWHYSQFADRMIFTEHKELCAGPDRILIDDNESNVIKFRDEGGNAVLVPRPWNSRYNENINVIYEELTAYAKS